MTDASPPANNTTAAGGIAQRWPSRHPVLLLTLLTLACLLPFSDKAFHMDDPLFLWTAQHIAQHPLDPYGFRVVWYATETSIADVTKNPPLASYYAAAFGRTFGWSERSLHVAFFLPALAVILGTYHLARRFTRLPLVAAAVTLFTPAFLVSGTTVMCDAMMLALWVVALIFWLEGTDSGRQWQFLLAALLIAASALTKYFGAALIPLLLAHSLFKKRKFDRSLIYLALPVLVLALYQSWTRGLYGRGLLSDAVQYASLHNRGHELPLIAKTLVGLAFAGGCFLPALFFSPLLWRRRGVFVGLAIAAGAGLAASSHAWWFQAPQASRHWSAVSVQIAVLVAAGMSAVILGASGIRKPNTDTVLLSLWLIGTFIFAVFVNWTINARSILPLVPVAAILLARKLDAAESFSRRGRAMLAGVAVLASAGFSLWVAWTDAGLANTGRLAAVRLSEELRSTKATIYFEGHWGFQYYIQQSGAKPADIRNSPFRAGDIVVIPENATNSFGPPSGFVLSDVKIMNFDVRQPLATMSQPLGAGFYASVWGPLPFAFGEIPPERYLIARLAPIPDTSQHPPLIFKPQ